jgi:hypothetical protein
MNLRIKFTCMSCGSETEIGMGMVNLICQKCNSYDLMFDQDAVVIPRFAGWMGKSQKISAGKPFYGKHENGGFWEVFPMDPNIEVPEAEEEGKEPPKKPKPTERKLARRKRKKP